MGLVSYPSKEEAAESVRPIYDNVAKKLGHMLNFFKAMAHSPEMLQAFMGLNATLSKTKLDPRLRELAYLATSVRNGCGYCMHYHRAAALRVGVTERQVDELAQYETSDAYDDRQRD